MSDNSEVKKPGLEFEMNWLSREELEQYGFAALGRDVKISRKASLYNPSGMSIGDQSRIDDFCVVSAGDGGISIGRNVHISAMTSIVGKASIVLEDFSGLSNKVAVFSSTDNFARGMTNPTIPDAFRRLRHSKVVLEKHVVVGSNSVLLPGSLLRIGSSVGALSVVRGELEPWGVYLGNPAEKVGVRSERILDIERQFRESDDF